MTRITERNIWSPNLARILDPTDQSVSYRYFPSKLLMCIKHTCPQNQCHSFQTVHHNGRDKRRTRFRSASGLQDHQQDVWWEGDNWLKHWLKKNHNKVMEWPNQSPELDNLGRESWNCESPRRNLESLESFCKGDWAIISPWMWQKVVTTYKKHFTAFNFPTKC